MNGLQYKKCDCDVESWEDISVDKDENYDFKHTIYYHCDSCGVDFRIEDFYTGEVLYEEKIIKMNEKELKPEDVNWGCRFHPNDWWHEIGCPHWKWTKEQLYQALLAKKLSEQTKLEGTLLKYDDPFEPIEQEKIPCFHPEHSNYPTHLYIPPGQSYIHVCPGCGKETILHGNAIIY